MVRRPRRSHNYPIGSANRRSPAAAALRRRSETGFQPVSEDLLQSEEPDGLEFTTGKMGVSGFVPRAFRVVPEGQWIIGRQFIAGILRFLRRPRPGRAGFSRGAWCRPNNRASEENRRIPPGSFWSGGALPVGKYTRRCLPLGKRLC
jgi:hypothetical protein